MTVVAGFAKPTFSIATAASGAHNPQASKVFVLPDTDTSGNSCTNAGGMANVMRQGGVFLAKAPDGALVLHKFDAERSTPSNPVIIRA